MPTKFSGKFIAVEGIDGSGKTTLSEGLARIARRKHGDRIIINSERPDESTPTGAAIKAELRNSPLNHRRLQILFSENRRALMNEMVLPRLREGYLVINDRYRLTTIAYGASEGLDRTWLENLSSDLLIPYYTFLLTVDPAVAVKRIQGKNIGKSPFEKEERLALIQQEYLKAVRTRRWMLRAVITIDANQDVETVLSTAANSAIDVFG